MEEAWRRAMEEMRNTTRLMEARLHRLEEVREQLWSQFQGMDQKMRHYCQETIQLRQETNAALEQLSQVLLGVVTPGIPVDQDCDLLAPTGGFAHVSTLEAPTFGHPVVERPIGYENDQSRLGSGEQNRRFFPHPEGLPASKVSHSPKEVPQVTTGQEVELEGYQNLKEVIRRMREEVPSVTILIHEGLGWSKKAETLPGGDLEQDKVQYRKVSVIEVLVPTVLRCIVSLIQAGSIVPDAVAFFSPNESGSHVHARGKSKIAAFRHITELAALALQHFLGARVETILYNLLHWICTYQTLFSQVCSNCGEIMAIDKTLSAKLPPVYRPYRNFSPMEPSPAPPSTKGQSQDASGVYHIHCLASLQDEQQIKIINRC